MSPRDHGGDAFVALLREAAVGTEVPLRAWIWRGAAWQAGAARRAALPDCPAEARAG